MKKDFSDLFNQEIWVPVSIHPKTTACYVCKTKDNTERVLYYNTDDNSWTGIYEGQQDFNLYKIVKLWKRKNDDTERV